MPAERKRFARGVVFDLDGVLIDTSRVWHRVVEDTAARLECPRVPWEVFHPTFGQGTAADCAQFFEGAPVEVVDRIYHERFLARLEEVERIDGAIEMLETLGERGICRAVATNTMRDLADALVERAGLAPRLDAVASASEVPEAKPAPDVVLLAAERLGLGPNEILYVGDAVYDAEAAAAAGIRFVGFRREGDFRVERLREIPALLS